MNYGMIEAGREMDALVAEKVMGWVVSYTYEGYPQYEVHGETLTSFKFVPEFSTSISAAWEIVEKIKDVNKDTACYDFNLTYQRYWGFGPIAGPHAEPIQEDRRWVCQFGKEYKDAPTTPLAICRAALKAMEETK